MTSGFLKITWQPCCRPVRCTVCRWSTCYIHGICRFSAHSVTCIFQSRSVYLVPPLHAYSVIYDLSIDELRIASVRDTETKTETVTYSLSEHCRLAAMAVLVVSPSTSTDCRNNCIRGANGRRQPRSSCSTSRRRHHHTTSLTSAADIEHPRRCKSLTVTDQSKPDRRSVVGCMLPKQESCSAPVVAT